MNPTDQPTPALPKNQDIRALKSCIKALDKSTSHRMLRANLEFILDRYIFHPSPELPAHLRKT